MRILFTKSNLPLSKAIRGLTGEDVSHCALDFGWFVVHSNLLGVHLQWGPNFRSECQVVKRLAPAKPLSLIEDMLKLNKLLAKYEFSLYDFGGLLFDGFCFLAHHYFKVPLPKKNLWTSTGMFLCTEWVTEYVEGYEDSTITPEQLYQKLKSSDEWKDVPDGHGQVESGL